MIHFSSSKFIKLNKNIPHLILEKLTEVFHFNYMFKPFIKQWDVGTENLNNLKTNIEIFTSLYSCVFENSDLHQHKNKGEAANISVKKTIQNQFINLIFCYVRCKGLDDQEFDIAHENVIFKNTSLNLEPNECIDLIFFLRKNMIDVMKIR